MDAEVGAVEFRFRVQSQAHDLLQDAIHNQAAECRDSNAAQRADQLRHQANAADSSQESPGGFG